jgi:uncharacterized membrane protein required for colicin V production
MNWVDFVLIALFVLAAISGWRAGLIPGVVVLVGLFLGVPLAARYGESLGNLILGEGNQQAQVTGFGTILTLTLAASAWIALRARRAVNVMQLKRADNLGGAVAGLAVGMVVLGSLLVVAALPHHPPQGPVEDLKTSKVARQVVEKNAVVRALFPDMSRVADGLDEFVRNNLTYLPRS